jgi:hypothetical protein
MATAPTAPAAGKIEIYATNDTAAAIKTIDENGVTFNLSNLASYSVATQTPITDSSRTYLTGSQIKIPVSGLKVGTVLEWEFTLNKTGAGTNTSVVDICFGTAGAVADSARVSFTLPAATNVADTGYFTLQCVIRSIGASGVAVGTLQMTHNLAATGLANIPIVVLNTVSAGFDMTYANCSYAGVCVTMGASSATTSVYQCVGKYWNL